MGGNIKLKVCENGYSGSSIGFLCELLVELGFSTGCYEILKGPKEPKKHCIY